MFACNAATLRVVNHEVVAAQSPRLLYYATNNVAKTVLELVTSIPRERLRANPGHGFVGGPLTTENSQEEVTRQDRGVRSESTTPEERVGGESDV